VLKVFSFLLIAIVLSVITACEFTTNETKWDSFNNFITKGEKNIIELRDGKTGKTVEIVEEEKVKEFLLLFEKINLLKVSDEEIKGYQYLANIGSDQILFFNKMIKINDQYYETDKEVPVEKIKKYFE
jgi:hypothetical protein